MKLKFTISAALLMLMITGAGRAATQEDAVLAFSTPGPDRYADGRSVMRNEIYALVWIRDEAEFGGVLSDGTLADSENSEIVIAQPNAWTREVNGETVGYCRHTLFQIPADFLATHKGGRFDVVLLDTRVKQSKNGGVEPAGNAENVLGWCAVASLSAASISSASSSFPRELSAEAGGFQTVASALAAPAELSGAVTITEWTRLPDGNWQLSFEAENEVLNGGKLASIAPDQSFSLRYGTSVKELAQDGETATRGYLSFGITERSLNDANQMKVKVIIDDPKVKNSSSLFVKIVDPRRE